MEKTQEKTKLFQFEDLLLIAWLIFVEPFLERQLPSIFAGEDPFHSKNPILGVLFIASAIAALFCIVINIMKHGLEGKDGGMTLEQYAVYPMFALTGLFVSTGLGMLKIPKPVVVTVVVLTLGTLIYLSIWQRKLLTRMSPYRRILMTPAIILGTWFFTDFITSIDIADDFRRIFVEGIAYVKNVGLGTALEEMKKRPENSFYVFMTFMIFCGILAQYMLFIIAPRKVAGSGGSFFQWFIRFILYMAGVIFNTEFFTWSVKNSPIGP